MRIKSVLFVGALCSAQFLFGQAAGTLDNTFNTTGVVATAFSVAGSSEAFDVARQADGKLVVAGNYTASGSARAGLARYNANGTLDNTFGAAGKVLVAGVGNTILRTVKVLSDGKILAAGNSVLVVGGTSKPVLMKFTSAGVADATFGTGGILEIGGGLNGINDIKLDGTKILGCGRLVTGPTSLVAFRLNANGTPDMTFGTGGYASLPSGGNLAVANRVGLQDGKVIVAGSFNPSGSTQKSIVGRLNADGTVDATFGTGGKFVSAFGATNEFCDNFAIQSDASIVACGRTQVGNAIQILAYRLTKTGALDATFGTGGKVTYAVGTLGEDCTAIAIQTDGKILLGGNSVIAGGKNAYIMRLTKAGAKDATFGTAGQTKYTTGVISNLASIQIQPDLKVVAAGNSYLGNTLTFSAYRFNAGTYTGTEEPSTLLGAQLFPNLIEAGINATYALELEASDYAHFSLYSTDGRLVTVLDSQPVSSGKQEITVQIPAHVPTGTYFLVVKGSRFRDTQSVMVK
jgi:uncharacterized delta-60 repeat protein